MMLIYDIQGGILTATMNIIRTVLSLLIIKFSKVVKFQVQCR